MSDDSDSDNDTPPPSPRKSAAAAAAPPSKAAAPATASNGLLKRLARAPAAAPVAAAATTTTSTAPNMSPRNREKAAATPPVVILGRRAARLEPVEYHRSLMAALFEEAANWSHRGLGVSVDFDEDPAAHRPPLTGLVAGASHERNNANPKRAESSLLRQYEFYPNAIECAAFAANQSHFPLGLMMGTDVQSTHFFANAPLLSAADAGAGKEAILLASQQRFQPLWRNIIRHNISRPSTRHLRVLGVSFKIGSDAALRPDEIERQLFHALITITLMAESHSPETVEALTASTARQDAKQRRSRRVEAD